MINITTGRMVIRNFKSGDWRDLQAVVIDKEASEYAKFDHLFPASEHEIKEITNHFAQGDSFLAVCETDGKKVIGYIAINNENQTEYNLGYCFHSVYQEKGYALEACTAVINYVFHTLKAEKFVTGTAKLNKPSCRLLTRLGFRKTGENIASLRKDETGKPVKFTGVTFKLTRDDWRKTQKISG